MLLAADTFHDGLEERGEGVDGKDKEEEEEEEEDEQVQRFYTADGVPVLSGEHGTSQASEER